jgi:dTDP-4-amino-4,6-dideoxy-D-galactose acyltransferase
MEVVRCLWDSEHFGYSVGRLDLGPDDDHARAIDALASAGNHKLVYVFSARPFHHSEARLVDVRELYALPLSDRMHVGHHPDIVPHGQEPHPALQELARASGIHSRFKCDPHFKRGEFHLLYDTWLRNSLSRKVCAEVFVCEREGEAVGLMTIERPSATTISIGLAAVHPDHRGDGIAKRLLWKGMRYGIGEGCAEFTVVTQGANLAARNLYASVGFKVTERKFVYHVWR